jgi:hypothetical protein
MVINVNIEVRGQYPKFDTLRKKFFGAHAMAEPKNGFAIAWAPNLHSRFYKARGYLKKVLRKNYFS